ncbi:hypothetical protein ACFS32_11410 [Novosphingobium pokkalii]|uniref:hypothetical protein n=1 Tax=Novosphingobium pokkalii TaxID=1770194 RepID=UPI0036435CC8
MPRRVSARAFCGPSATARAAASTAWACSPGKAQAGDRHPQVGIARRHAQRLIEGLARLGQAPFGQG